MSVPKTQEIIESIVGLIRERLPPGSQGLGEEFVRQYFGGTAPDDLTESDDLDLYGAAMAHLNYAKNRVPGSPKVHVYNPQLEQHGWQSTHTIIEIVTDDMPFLVDSVRMAVNRRGLTTHHIIHPVMQLRRDEQGYLTDVLRLEDRRGNRVLTEAIMHCEVDRQTESELLEGIRVDVESALADVKVVVEDWQAMRDKLAGVLMGLQTHTPQYRPGRAQGGEGFPGVAR